VSVYKYVREDRVDVLESGMIRFSQPAVFNDPFELRPAMNRVLSEQATERGFEHLAQEEPDMQRHRGPILNDVKQRSSREAAAMQEYLPRRLNENFGILSLTKRPDSLLMWAHYANGHQGFVIEFDERHPWFRQGHEGFAHVGRLRKVRYSKRRPYASMDELDEIDILLTKSVQWKYERERRLVVALQKCTQRLPGSPFDICLFALPPICVAGITLGCGASSATEDRIRQILSDERYAHVKKLRRAKVDDSTFMLNVVDA
jgi:hypothetical protein